jgi:putative flippase GtrA
MKKTDGLISLIIGFFIGVFFFIILKSTDIIIPYSWALIIVFPFLALIGMFVASWLGKKFLIIFQAGKFVMVGALNTFIDLGVLNLLMLFFGVASGLFFAVFKGISFLVATTNSYFWNKHWTFQKREKVFSSQEFYKFLIVTTIGLFINVGVASFVFSKVSPWFEVSLEMWGTIGAVTAALIAWVWNFLSSKFIVFKS